MALPRPPKVGYFHLVPGVILLLIGIIGPVLELIDRHQHPIKVHTATVTDTHFKTASSVGDTGSHGRSPRTVRVCDIRLPNGTTDSVQCSDTAALKTGGSQIRVYRGSNGVWRVYDPNWFWIVRGLLFILAGLAYVGVWVWFRRARRQPDPQTDERPSDRSST